MNKAVGALVAIAIVILGASMVAQQPAAPAPSAPIPAGLPDWAYTPPPRLARRRRPPRSRPMTMRWCRFPGPPRRSRAGSCGLRRKRWTGTPRIVTGPSPTSPGSGNRACASAPSVISPTAPGGRRTLRSAPITPPISCSRCRTSGTDCGRAPIRGRRTPTP